MEKKTLNMPPRFQWQNNGGYCGEVALISAGLMFGQYVSQYMVRSLIGSQSDQVLLGSDAEGSNNAVEAAKALHLQNVAYQESPGNTKTFLTWVKGQVVQGNPVIIGVYMNECQFHPDKKDCKKLGDPKYDHIVPVFEIQSSDLASLTYDGSDIISFSDNGLWGPDNNPSSPPCIPNPNPNTTTETYYIYSSTFDAFQNTREGANDSSSSAPIYSITSDQNTYALAILGVNGEGTLPITVTTKTSASQCTTASESGYVNYEAPEISEGGSSPPSSMPITLTVVVTISDPSQSYNVYLYTDLSAIPDANFNASKRNAAKTWVIPPKSGTSYTITLDIMSNEVAAFRAVSTTAP